MGGFQMAAIPDMTGAALTYTAPPPFDPAGRSDDAAEYTALWSRMNLNLAQEILETGVWDDLPVTHVQRQVAFDFVKLTAPSYRQVQLEEV